MVHISIKRGLNIPLKGNPEGELQELGTPKVAALDLSRFDTLRFQLHKRVGDQVKMGEPMAEDKSCPGRMFVSPVSGRVVELVRGEKRRLLHMVVEIEGNEVHEVPGDGLDRLMHGGGFSHIRRRPCNVLASPLQMPRSIFVKAVETGPFRASPALAVAGHEELFQAGIDALKEWAPVHLVEMGEAFKGVQHVIRHTVSGAHPAGNVSVHIAKIDPIKSVQDVVWTLDVEDVLVVGSIMRDRHYFPQRVIGLGGTGFTKEERRFVSCLSGYPIKDIPHQGRLISGDPLMGQMSEYLCAGDRAVSAILDEGKGEFLHFMRPGLKRYTQYRGYLSALFKRNYALTTMMHGEPRAFIDGSFYNKVMPLPLSTMHLVKALMCEDFEKAEELGILEVAAEDFALPTFICPSKIEMTEIVSQGLKTYAENYLSV
ncbi:MAG: Na(+)-translocating NADH-quinone reductase subunit A [Chlamydiia bacterium]|nr:Na(+)-translocating NADH-quinone reductase subunit A [Chlamydiia bacterium]MCH9616395.1 Na(+)-translocating NADH-quinone reductase subunit A [Chlamydiia bacterium]MCH9629619.1 Na(+)-translocating NADH-quinone reductase subunit A [Chlamydiia bacterium]